MSATPAAGPQRGTFGPSALLTPANAVTVVRLVVAPFTFWWIVEEAGRDGGATSWALLLVWFVLTTSDGLDGYLARRQGATRSGAFLDPLADKVLSLGGLWAVVLAGRFAWLPVVLMTVREVLISAFRSYWGRKGLAVPASTTAKFKTVLQFGAVGWVLWPWFTDVRWLTDGFLWAAVAVSWVSAAQYLAGGSRATSSMAGDGHR